METYPRGSEWRKWDLQVQPIKNKWFKNLNDNVERIEKSVHDFIDKAIEKTIDVIAITDHNTGISIDFANEYAKDKNIVILPGVELDANSGEHILVIFNPNYKNKLKKEKWSETIDVFLQKCKIDPPFFNEGTPKKIKITTEELIKIVNSEDIGIIIFAHCTSNDGFFQRSGDANKRKMICENFYSKDGSFIFEIKNANKKQEIIEKLNGWGLNPDDFPIISSSDANQARDVGKFFTWIKADPTFEGLKQIIYEPEDRVRIQEEKPEQKEPYNLIDYVQFVDTKETFTNEKIYLNQNLNVIIGGKSTGKSILLREMARTINPNEVKNRLEEANLKDYKIYEDGRTLTDDFIVQWVDDREDKRFNKIDNYRKIIYIPQSYLNRLVEKDEEQSPIDRLIENILKNEENVKHLFENLDSRINENNRNISNEINELIQNLQQSSIKLEEIKNLGDKEGIEKYIEKIKNEIEDLHKKGGLTDEEINQFNTIKNSIKELKNEISYFSKQKEDYEKLLNIIKIAKSYEFNQIAEKYEQLKIYANSLISRIEDEFNKYLQGEIDKLNYQMEEKTKELQNLEDQIKPLSEKVENIELLKKKNEILSKQEEKLNQIKEKEAEKEKFEEKKESSINKLVDYFIKFYEIKSEFTKEVEQNNSLGDDLDLKIKVNPKNEKFNEEFIKEIFDSRSLPDNLKDFNLNIKNINDLKEKIKNLIIDILNSKVKLKKQYNNNIKEILQKLIKDWFVINYSIIYDGDKISDMSQGKKSFVLLRLIIELDKSKCPLLIDQPEDDLDNRSIYNEIVKFLKEKKKERQIIIITHNANLAVATDAECIIVANQDGEKTKNKKFKFEYVQGSLENTFIKDGINEILYKQGIKEHVCEILEGGEQAFEKRKNKYNFK